MRTSAEKLRSRCERRWPARFGAACGVLGLLGGTCSAAAETWVWVDGRGMTHFTDDAALVPERSQEEGTPWETLGGLWADGLEGPVLETPPGRSGGRQNRALRILYSAVDDLALGEEARAGAALRSVLRLWPAQPEPHWYLAEIEQQRGRYALAANHLKRFLDAAGPELESWRTVARRRLARIEEERRLANPTADRGPLRLLARQSPHFEVQVDAELETLNSDFARRALADLERARAQVAEHIGVVPAEPLGVVFYGRAAYARAHSHRFSFRTVGFFDGRIHVAAPAHPSAVLGPLLFHEYSHAVFRERTGGDRPYWLNEGLAIQSERREGERSPSTRSERALVRARLETGDWTPLGELAAGFSGLSDGEVGEAYLQSLLVVEWISGRTRPADRARLLDLLGAGFSPDQALHAVLGLSSEELEAAVQVDLRAEFPRLKSAALAPVQKLD
ncbi:MAG: DUF4124 domain-containing protein [Myxococcota bacterium]